MDPTTLAALAAFPAQLEAHFGAIPVELRHWKPATWDGCPSERLTALEQICHVRDIETDGYRVRFRRTLEENKPYLPGVDTYGLVEQRSYGKADPAQVFAQFRQARVETLRLLKTLGAEQLSRPAEFEDYGAVTLRSLVHYLCSHDQQHLAGLQWLAGRIQSGKG